MIVNPSRGARYGNGPFSRYWARWVSSWPCAWNQERTPREESSGMGSRPSARRAATSWPESGSDAATEAWRWFLRATAARAMSSRRLPSTTSATLSFAGTIVVLSGSASASATTGYVASLARSANRRAVAAAVEAIVRANRARGRTATRGIAARTRLAASTPRESVTFDLPPAPSSAAFSSVAERACTTSPSKAISRASSGRDPEARRRRPRGSRGRAPPGR